MAETEEGTPVLTDEEAGHEPSPAGPEGHPAKPRYAGKYNTLGALTKALVEVSGKLGVDLDIDKYDTPEEIEAEYKRRQKLLGKRGPAEPEPKEEPADKTPSGEEAEDDDSRLEALEAMMADASKAIQSPIQPTQQQTGELTPGQIAYLKSKGWMPPGEQPARKSEADEPEVDLDKFRTPEMQEMFIEDPTAYIAALIDAKLDHAGKVLGNGLNPILEAMQRGILQVDSQADWDRRVAKFIKTHPDFEEYEDEIVALYGKKPVLSTMRGGKGPDGKPLPDGLQVAYDYVTLQAKQAGKPKGSLRVAGGGSRRTSPDKDEESLDRIFHPK